MVRAGLEKIEKAKKNGSWTILDEMENLIVSPDLKEAFKKNKKARNNYNVFTDSVKKQILWFVISAKI
ncbi:MAG: YdeI/OmpD-associated family protein [Methanobacteriaceae archaeon]|nr:YdeI/OmpD-associated family protein [Methanobacteriaceae archaeon]MDZ4171193.1 YdeI/OmpD-associated family protein [Methanobacteriaceae archaeon]